MRELKLWRKMRLSQLERLIDAMGGRLSCQAEFPDRSIRITPSEAASARERIEKPVPEKSAATPTNSEILQMWRDAERT